ncbi:uncharacterized protein PADG_04141 [Paracoccidioides brasiliensis Pb18]|uniref:Uncharacterized protein n=1 Tax=Paracoccidioides brasiliensis (strain Pb18) TaxID=502780 RepID=C1GA55_PARBD|nr:uncharacterized protein PADG_04141 [Paracoccidioides brasiliensis Pb18]EEH48057.1 hypothetical protein PADG_04141 [Paracoccidioides brasiliensis Pb18]
MPMRVAEILSDLTSLRVCGHPEALVLVNVHKTLSNSETDHQQHTQHSRNNNAQSEDLRRARDLIELHNDVMLKQLNRPGVGLNEELRKARQDVDRVLRELDR